MSYISFLGFFVGWIGTTIYMHYQKVKKSFNMFLTEDHPDELKGDTGEMIKLSLLYTLESDYKVIIFFFGVSFIWLLIFLMETYIF